MYKRQKVSSTLLKQYMALLTMFDVNSCLCHQWLSQLLVIDLIFAVNETSLGYGSFGLW